MARTCAEIGRYDCRSCKTDLRKASLRDRSLKNMIESSNVGGEKREVIASKEVIYSTFFASQVQISTNSFHITSVRFRITCSVIYIGIPYEGYLILDGSAIQLQLAAPDSRSHTQLEQLHMPQSTQRSLLCVHS